MTEGEEGKEEEMMDSNDNLLLLNRLHKYLTLGDNMAVESIC